MSLDWKKWTKNDIIFGIILPVIAVFVIVLVSKLPSLFGGGFGIVTGLTMEIAELVVIVGVPLALGLLWNQWAGGASGFLMGTFYALYWANSFHGISGSGTVLLAYILSPMLIGYMAGALNKRSDNFKRILISALVAATIGGIVIFSVFQMSSCKRSHRNNRICTDRLGTYARRCSYSCCGQSFLLVRHGDSQTSKYFLTLLFLGIILNPNFL